MLRPSELGLTWCSTTPNWIFYLPGNGGPMVGQPAAEGRISVGRIGMRTATLAARPETVPVHIQREPPRLSRASGEAEGHPLYDREIQRLHPGRLSALIASLYAAHGYEVVLLPEGCAAGASAIAVRGGQAWLLRTQTDPVDTDSLETLCRVGPSFAAWSRMITVWPGLSATVVRRPSRPVRVPCAWS